MSNLKPNLSAAKLLGSVAFATGRKCVPAHDSNLSKMFKNRQAGDKRTLPEIKAWLDGWHEANLAAARHIIED